MDTALNELIALSQKVGNDLNMVRGSGGNISVKSDDGQYMYIKASGVALKDLREDFGWRRLQLDLVRSILTDKRLMAMNTLEQEEEVYKNLILSCRDEMPLDWAPSIESHLHAFLGNVVIHLHPLAVCSLGNARNGTTIIKKLFKDNKKPPLILGYCNPGYTFARKLAGAIQTYQKQYGGMPEVVFHEKHGIFVSADSGNIALNLLRKAVKVCDGALPKLLFKATRIVEETTVNDIKLAIRRAYFEVTGNYVPVTYHHNELIDTFCRRQDGKALMRLPLAPDEIAYADGPALWVDKKDSSAIQKQLVALVDKGFMPAAAYIVQNVGLFLAGELSRVNTIRSIAENSMLIRSYAAKLGGVTGLTPQQRGFVEMFEEGGHAHGCGCTPLQNRIAIVTGAGSGLGRSIAIGLARAGAMVALADIDEKAINETAAMIAEELPDSITLALPSNVTSEESVKTGFNKLMANWGGVDIMVNAAGVAPAYSLVDFPVDKWRFAMEVNLTGYFLMTREAARIMIKQGMEGAIINLSSKSGLDASKNNTAYNASKSGEIHMARGWALELGQYGIRVNSICPGNVFEGSKIWNPTYIEECARKYGIKPEEVIPYYVNRTTLKKEIKGQDIADGVVFLCSDQARTITGQTLVIDSGQVMVR